MRDTAEGGDRRTNGVWCDPSNQAHAHGGENIADAVLTGECDLVHWKDSSARSSGGDPASTTCGARYPRCNNPSIDNADSPRDGALSAISNGGHTTDPSERCGDGVVKVHDQQATVGDTIGEDPLHLAVSVYGAVPIKMIHGDVGIDSNVNAAVQ